MVIKSAAVLALFAIQVMAEVVPVQRIGVDSSTGMSEVIVMPEAATWYSSRVVAAVDSNGTRPSNVREQFRSILNQNWKPRSTNTHEVVRLNISLRQPDSALLIRQELEEYFETVRPVVTFVGSEMSEPDVLVAMDAFGITGNVSTDEEEPSVSLCPPGPKVYISGKAANGDLAMASRDTLQQIDDNLTFLKLTKSDIVQLRAFVSNISEIAAFQGEVRTYFGDLPRPAVTFTQWISSGYPIEIEAVVRDTSGVPVTEMEFITPPGETASPVFCRVVRVPAGPLIFTSGLTGEAGTDPTAQVARIFDRLKPLLEQSGSDMQHLAKATYFCGDEASSSALNAIRPGLYTPERPPAASKAIVPHVGLDGRVVAIDWIAVPVRTLK